MNAPVLVLNANFEPLNVCSTDMGVQIIHYQDDALGGGEYALDDIADQIGPVLAGTPLRDACPALAQQGGKDHKDIGDLSITHIFSGTAKSVRLLAILSKQGDVNLV